MLAGLGKSGERSGNAASYSYAVSVCLSHDRAVLMICSTTATLNLKLFATFFVPILIHMVFIILLMSFITMVLLRRWMKRDWFELAMGVAAPFTA